MSIKSYAHYEVKANFAVITLDNPPVNALSPALVEELMHAISQATADPQVIACIITGSNGKFSGGADITSFKDLNRPGAKSLRHLLAHIEQISKPVIAAIDGICLGGGLELALTCDYRCTTKNSSLGLPEIKLGLLPGAGGTQRLSRLIGQKAALEIILSGESISAEKAFELGIIDEIVQGDWWEEMTKFAIKQASKNSRRKLSELTVTPDGESIAAWRKKAAPGEQGGLAQIRAIDCIEAAGQLSFAEGMSFERNKFEELLRSTQAKSRMHIFFAERAVAKIPGLSPDAKPVTIKTAAVIGAGTMGNGIAMNFLNAGIPVTMIDTSQELVERGKKAIEGNYASALKKGKLQQSDVDACLKNLTLSTNYDNLKDTDIVIEAVFENMKIKQGVFAKLSDICGKSAILATNTSTLDIDKIANATADAGRVIGMHFFSPANVMKLLEIVRGRRTSDQAIATALKVGKMMKKVGVLVGNCDGFVGNRMLGNYVRESELLLEEGATPEQVDKVMTQFGFAMGPFAVGDLAGIDIHNHIRQERAARDPLPFRVSNISGSLYEKGRYGQKTGAGWYRYEPGNRKPIADAEVTDIILAESKKLGITRKEIADETIIKRCLYPLINEGAKILEEGIAIRSSDIDIIWIYGYGFPPFRGGPMFYADTIGLKNILADLKEFQKEHGDFWQPAPLLEKLAQSNQTFADFKGV